MNESYQNKNEIVSINFKKEFSYYLFFWPWFLASLTILLTASYIYLRYADIIYQSVASVIITDSNSNPATLLNSESQSLFNLDNVNLENEIGQIKSMSTMFKVVQDLNLNIDIYEYNGLKKTLVFGTETPFEINFFENKPCQITIDLNKEGAIISTKKTNYVDELNARIGTDSLYVSNLFRITFKPNAFEKKQKFSVAYSPLLASSNELIKKIQVTPASKSSQILNLTIKGTNKKKNEAVLDAIIESIKSNKVSEQREIYDVTLKFIEQRIAELEQNLALMTSMTVDFQSETFLFSAESQIQNSLTNLNLSEVRNLEFDIRLELAETFLSKLENQEDYSLIPISVGFESNAVSTLIAQYNQIIQEHNKLLESSTSQNPLISQIRVQLDSLKLSIIENIQEFIASTKQTQSAYKYSDEEKKKEISSIPKNQERLRGLLRNYQIAESLYVFLLQRKEEVLIAYSSVLPNLKIINAPTSGFFAVSPNKKMFYLGSIILAFLLPFSILYILKILDTKIHTREMLTELFPSKSILGEIPWIDLNTLNNPRGIAAESSRIIRSNIGYMLPKTDTGKVLLVTSSTKGEGKSFVAYSIACSYAATSNKVLLIGGDLRNPKLHRLLNIDRKEKPQGLSTLLSSNIETEIDDYIFSKDVFNNSLDILLSGAIPPNPSELLSSTQFLNLLELLKTKYDYIIFDSAPILLVSDTIPLLDLADLTLYVFRAQHTDKNVVPFISNLLVEKNFPVGMVLNGLIESPNSIRKYNYNYRYSYKYNYGYGYGYSEDKS